ncbi:Uncharacterised protein [Streptococcus pneumoniae]|nr:Uncharacterised protein [Streptococcus pneumoniae]
MLFLISFLSVKTAANSLSSFKSSIVRVTNPSCFGEEDISLPSSTIMILESGSENLYAIFSIVFTSAPSSINSETLVATF